MFRDACATAGSEPSHDFRLLFHVHPPDLNAQPEPKVHVSNNNNNIQNNNLITFTPFRASGQATHAQATAADSRLVV
jgi:hypothetical protein